MNKLTGYMEVSSFLEDTSLSFSQINLRDAARQAPIHTFGWPIGVFLETDQYKPKPVEDGILAEVITPKDQWGGTYDYWYLRNNASFYLLQSLFEDSRESNKIYFETRIVRVTETLLYLARLYLHLNIKLSTKVYISIAHGGLANRTLKSAGRRFMFEDRTSVVDLVKTELETTVGQLESELVPLVKKVVSELFVVFDYFELQDNILEEIVKGFVNGQIL